jgi:hypothetical protein
VRPARRRPSAFFWHSQGISQIVDLLWQNDQPSSFCPTLCGRTTAARRRSGRCTASLGNPGPDWHVFGTGDYNNDGKSDILWQNSTPFRRSPAPRPVPRRLLR